jgi:hypothetical protein
MTTFLEQQIERQSKRQGADSPFVQMMRDQLAAQRSGNKSVEALYVTGSVNKPPDKQEETENG